MDRIASTLIDSWRKQCRPAAFFNTTAETAPPYACMQKRRAKSFSESSPATNTQAENQYFCQHLRGGQHIWDITKCNEDGQARQDPSEFMFNGPVPCPSLRYGEGTEDYPCQVLHDGTNDSLPNRRTCGPVANRWWVLSGGSAWSCVSHDVLAAAGENFVHTVWIRPATRQALSAHGRSQISGTYSSGAYITFGTESLVTAFGAGGEDSEWLKTLRSGMYWFSFHAKVTSATAPRAAPLSVTLYKALIAEGETVPGSPVTTGYIGERDQDIERDNYGTEFQKTAENVAFSGIENLKKGELLRLRNTSAHSIVLTSGMFSIMNVGQYFNLSGDGGYNFDAG